MSYEAMLCLFQNSSFGFIGFLTTSTYSTGEGQAMSHENQFFESCLTQEKPKAEVNSVFRLTSFATLPST